MPLTRTATPTPFTESLRPPLPYRVQRRRLRDWRKPTPAVAVTRPSPFGNPFTPEVLEARLGVTGDREAVRALSASWFERWMAGDARAMGWTPAMDDQWLYIRANIGLLSGLNLMCWCPHTDPAGNPTLCHGDVLLRYASRIALTCTRAVTCGASRWFPGGCVTDAVVAAETSGWGNIEPFDPQAGRVSLWATCPRHTPPW